MQFVQCSLFNFLLYSCKNFVTTAGYENFVEKDVNVEETVTSVTRRPGDGVTLLPVVFRRHTLEFKPGLRHRNERPTHLMTI